MAETSFVSCQMLGDFISLRSGEGLTSFNEKNRANFSGKKTAMKLSGVLTFWEYVKKFKVKFRPRI